MTRPPSASPDKPSSSASAQSPDCQQRLAKEIAQSCLAVRFRAINRALTVVYDEALRPLQLKTSQLNVLVAIGSQTAVQPSQLAAALMLEKSTLSRNVDKLQRGGWVRARSAEGRGQLLELTDAGHRLLAEAEPLWREAQERVGAVLGPAGIEAIHRMHGDVLERRG